MLLGDMGAEVIKIENARRGRPGAPAGRDTRRPQLVFRWVRDAQVGRLGQRHAGRDVAVQGIVRARLIGQQIGRLDLAPHQLGQHFRGVADHADALSPALNRDLVCCHITGFGANLNNAMISMLGFLAANCLATGEQPGAQRQRPCDRLALWHVPHRRRRGGDRALQRSGLL